MEKDIVKIPKELAELVKEAMKSDKTKEEFKRFLKEGKGKNE